MTGARYLDSSSANGLPRSVDVLIIGSGPTGSAYARVLSQTVPHASILMVEAGPKLTNIPGLHVRNIHDVEQRAQAVHRSEGRREETDTGYRATLFDANAEGPAPVPGTFFINPAAARENRAGTLPAAAMSCNVGGMGAHWGGATPSPRGREKIQEIPEDEWAAALSVGKDLLSVDNAPLTDAHEWDLCLKTLGNAFNAELPADGQVQNMPVGHRFRRDGGDYWAGADTVLGPLALKARDIFAIAPDTLCTQLLTDKGHVGGAMVENRFSGRRTRILAKVVIVAADAFRTPQLLWASGIRPNALGRYLNEHLMVGSIVTPDYLDAPDDPTGLFEDDRTILDMVGAPSNGAGWIPNSGDVHPLHGQFGQTVIHQEGRARGTGLVMFGYFFAKEARFQDRVYFRDDVLDAYGMPSFDFEYSLTPRDLELRDLAYDRMRLTADALGAPDSPVVMQPDGMSLHYLGTFRMGADDDGSSVCDTYSKVWGYDNLFVAGNGVIPSELACNPTLTSVSLAVRGAGQAARVLTNALG